MTKKWKVTFVWHGGMEVVTDEETTDINEEIQEYVDTFLSQLTEQDGTLEREVEEDNA